MECQVDPVNNKLLVRISEGVRSLCDAVQIVGAKRIPTDELANRLRQQSPPIGATIASYVNADGHKSPKWVDNSGNDVQLEDPVWSVGKPAVSDLGAMKWYQEKIARCLSDLGFPAAQFKVELVSDRIAHTTAMQIRVSDEGPEPVIREIQIAGNKINSQRLICDYLGLRTGILYSGEAAAGWRERLWRSGRFVGSDIVVTPCGFGNPGLALRIDVVELKVAPPLDSALLPEEAALLRFREWLIGSFRAR